VIVFRSVEGQLPRGDRWYRAGRDTLESAFLNAGREPDIGQPEQMIEYFRRLYATGQLDARQIESLRGRQLFATIWSGDNTDKSRGRYRIIDDETFPVLVATWEPHRAAVATLLANSARRQGLPVLRELSKYQVNFRSYDLVRLESLVTTEANGMRVWHGKYDERRGVVPEQDELDLVV